jgi:hypothetical protein
MGLPKEGQKSHVVPFMVFAPPAFSVCVPVKHGECGNLKIFGDRKRAQQVTLPVHRYYMAAASTKIAPKTEAMKIC